MLLAGNDGDTAITRGCASICHIFRSVGEEACQVYHKHALRYCVVESSKSSENRQAILQRHRDEIGGPLDALRRSDSN